MAKKKLKAKKPDHDLNNQTDEQNEENNGQLQDEPMTAEQQIRAIIEKGKKKGYLTYEEMNDNLPEEAVSPARLDRLLSTLGEMGIKLLDEADIGKRGNLDDEDFDISMVDDDDDDDEDDELLEKQLLGSDISRRIDDPIRMYLTQMGEIPLLTRKEEISLARKIELARMAFRRKMLESDYCAKN